VVPEEKKACEVATSETLPESRPEQPLQAPIAALALTLVRDACPQDAWKYFLEDSRRRSFVGYLPSPFPAGKTKELFELVRDGTEWTQPEGPIGPIPRKTAWMVGSRCRCTYRYGGVEVPPTEYPPWMTELMRLTLPHAGLNHEIAWPTSCNLNLYANGGMCVGWHADDEALFQGKFQDTCIISLSLGARRKFELRPNWPGEGEIPVQQLILNDGDLCTMEGMCQKHYQHRVPKERYVQGPRINLTWRWIVKHMPGCPATRLRMF